MDLNQMLAQFNMLVQHISQLEAALINIDINHQALNLQIRLLQNKLIEHEVMTKEELTEAIKKEVEDPINQHVDELRKQHEERIKQAQEAAKKQEDSKILIPLAEEASNIIDMSNKFSK